MNRHKSDNNLIVERKNLASDNDLSIFIRSSHYRIYTELLHDWESKNEKYMARHMPFLYQ